MSQCLALGMPLENGFSYVKGAKNEGPQGLLGELPRGWRHYCRLPADGQVRSTLGFPRYRPQTWRMASLGAMGRAALDRARQRVRAAVLGSTSRPGR